MAFLLKGKKEDLIALAKQFGVSVESDLTKPKIKDLILKSEDYDEEDAKAMLDSIIEDRHLAEVEKQNEREERLRKEEREHELEKLRIQAQRNVGHGNSADTSITNKASQEMFHRFNMKDDISLNLTLFEHHANLALLPKEQWVQKLLGLIPLEIAHLIAREPEEKSNDYEHVKNLLLQRFKLSPEKLRQLFVSHQKAPEKTWQDFYHELQTYFDGWVTGLKIDTYEKLRELIIADQMKRKAPPELQNHFLDEWSSINSPADVARKFEQYDDVRRTLKPKASDLFFRRKDEVQGANKFQNYPRRPANFRDGNNKFEKRPLQLNRNSCVEKNKPWRPVNCCYCQTLGHFGVDCPRRPKNTKSNKPLAPIVQVCSELSREKMRTRKVALRSKTFYALIDTGSSVTLLREDICKQIIKLSELSRETIILSGLGKSQVKTKGSFRQDIELDGQKYSLT
ncbi:uncharacterized protein LOC129962050 [Argiope bruennichi]|uniref:uncharacterized protein LOC129962050 n=1 Tax=Argiope bruennichi TaxID=94029 RepID=UPI002494F50C|nr:uncharacterized protein LOC129962050 [Argiope bruennichi]